VRPDNNLDRIRKRESDTNQTSLLVTDKSGYQNDLKMFSNEFEHNILDEEEDEEGDEEMVSDQNKIHQQQQQHDQNPSRECHKKRNNHQDQQDDERSRRHEQAEEKEEELDDEDQNLILNTEDHLFNASDIMVSFNYYLFIFLIYLVYRVDWVDLNL